MKILEIIQRANINETTSSGAIATSITPNGGWGLSPFMTARSLPKKQAKPKKKSTK